MKTFKDRNEKSWTVDINVRTVKRVKSMLEVNLLEALEGKLITKLAADPILLCDVIYVICKPEADEAKITDEQFGAAMAGDAIESATEALLAELVDFFPQAKRRALRKALEKYKKVQELAVETAVNYLDSEDVNNQIENALKGITNSFGNLPE